MNKEQFKINVPYLSQRDNILFPYTTCYPTSMSMAIDYCLKSIKEDKSLIGCPSGKQLEDYITEIHDSEDVKNWLKKNVNLLGRWILEYKPRTIAKVEEYVFNKLMNEHGFKSTFILNLTYENYCKHIKEKQLPIVLHGNFSSVSTVKGHIVCGVGFDTLNNKKNIIVNDPYGDATTGYKEKTKGKDVAYIRYFFIRNKEEHMWGQIIDKI